jgi:hypothetical protein
MRLMGGAAVESGVVGVLFGVGAGRPRKSDDTLTGGTRPASTQSKAIPKSTATSADEGVRATPTAKRLGERAEAAFLARASGLGFGKSKAFTTESAEFHRGKPQR